MKINEYFFNRMGTLELKKNEDGSIYVHSFKGKDHGKYSVTEFTNLDYCRLVFEVNRLPNQSGVYAFVSNNEVMYIGEAVNLKKRFENGYAVIYQRNVYKRGRSTNCRINNQILNHYLKGKTIDLYFYPTKEYKSIESKLIESLNPEFNIKGKKNNKMRTPNVNVTKQEKAKKLHASSNYQLSINSSHKSKYNTRTIQEYIKNLVEIEFSKNSKTITITSGEIHKELNLNNQMPQVCGAMKNLEKEYPSQWLSDRSKPKTSTLKIKYFNKNYVRKKTTVVALVKEYILQKIQKSFKENEKYIDIKSGDIHRELKIKNNYPSVCSAMRYISQDYRTEVLDEPRKGNGAKLRFRYYNPEIL